MAFATEDDFLDFLNAYKDGLVSQMEEPNHSIYMRFANDPDRAREVYRAHEKVRAGDLDDFKEIDLEGLLKDE